MYERSAIVLENYFEKLLGLNSDNNLKDNYLNFCKVIEKIKEYQRVIEEEESVIKKFEESASEIQELQKKQNKFHEMNVKVEEERNELFNDLGENTSSLDQKLKKIEETIDENNEILKELREKYVKALIIFTERQRERNKYARMHRTTEGDYINIIKQVNYNFEKLDISKIKIIKNFLNDYERINEEIAEIMLKNGRNERVPFNEQVIKEAIEERSRIAREEGELYISIYERMKKLLVELNNGTIKLAKSEKLLRDVSVKLAFLQAKKEYIISFLDNERMTAMNGRKAHSKLMEEACNNFSLDIKQIDNLYELIIKETMGKATKKAYKELYNKTYLKEIEAKEKDFEQEAINVKINMGTLINSNYWRIEGIKNIYNVFQDEVSEKFEKDLSEYRIEEVEEVEEVEKVEKVVEVVENKEEINDNVEEEKVEKINLNLKIDNKLYDDEEDFDTDYDDEDDEDYQDVVFDDEEEADMNFEDDDYYDDDDYEEDDEDENYYDDEDDYEDSDYEEDDDENGEEVIDDDITEEKIEQIIRNSRKGKNGNKQERGLFGKLFKK